MVAVARKICGEKMTRESSGDGATAAKLGGGGGGITICTASYDVESGLTTIFKIKKRTSYWINIRSLY